jgi:dual specificity MAP kinase phosphatase
MKEKEEGSWEFVPAKVPDGISLRNFGIQVVSVVVAHHFFAYVFQPIYATLSDIVIYSPYGVTPAALAVARRFRQSIKAKRMNGCETLVSMWNC